MKGISEKKNSLISRKFWGGDLKFKTYLHALNAAKISEIDSLRDSCVNNLNYCHWLSFDHPKKW